MTPHRHGKLFLATFFQSKKEYNTLMAMYFSFRIKAQKSGWIA